MLIPSVHTCPEVAQQQRDFDAVHGAFAVDFFVLLCYWLLMLGVARRVGDQTGGTRICCCCGGRLTELVDANRQSMYVTHEIDDESSTRDKAHYTAGYAEQISDV